MTNTWKKVGAISLAAVMLAGSLAGCGKKAASIDPENPEITIMTKAFNAESASPDSPVTKALEDFVGSKLNIQWIPTSGYDEKVTAAMGSGEYPQVMLVGSRSSSVIQNSRAGTFWDITDKLTDAEKFPNLAKTNPNVNHNISIDGRVYGLYRARTIGRAGVSIRKDWLDNLNLEMPKTVDDLYNVMKAFKEQDPDKNGQDDTFGMIITNYIDGPLNNLAIWMGAPNQWGVNEETDELEPMQATEGFKDALDFLRKCYAEGLINQDMATYDSEKWNEQFLQSKAGIIIDVADRARRLAQNMQSTVPEAVVDVFGYVTKDANTEPRTLPTTGYDGYYVFPKSAIPTEEDLDFVLGVMDKCNEQEALNLMNYGIEGRSYSIENGHVVKVEDSAIKNEYNDLNQFSTGIVATDLTVAYSTDVAEKIDQVYKDNEVWAIPNPAEPYVSNTYSTKGPQLDAIIAEANTKYIVGQISWEDWQAQYDRWMSQGGADIIKEMNEAYKADKSIQK